MSKYRFEIYDEEIELVQTVFADSALMEGTIVSFSTDGDVTMLYNLPPGFSILKEED